MQNPSPLSWRHHVALRRSARARSVRLKIHPSARIELVIPKGFDERQVPAILDRHEAWVLRTLDKLGGVEALRPVSAPTQVALPAIDSRWEVNYLADDGGRYGCRAAGEERLRVSGGRHWQTGLRRWLVREGRQHLAPWLESVSEELGLPYRGVTVRLQRTRWGSCSSRGQINLNAGLLFLPPALVRYLLVHELCHTVHMNHSAAYWRLVGEHEPEYRQLDHALRRANSRVPGWVHATEVAAAAS